jgi:hypothetical protein
MKIFGSKSGEEIPEVAILDLVLGFLCWVVLLW